MKPKTLPLLFLLTLLCTCGRAQQLDVELLHTTTNVAFIKDKTGFIIDSITIRTSLDTTPYGFAFTGDTLMLDLTIFAPVDQITIETFGGGHPFGRQVFWVDAPTANVYLEIEAGRGKIGDIGLSPVDDWYEEQVVMIKMTRQPKLRKVNLRKSLYYTWDNLMAARFLEAYFNLPDLTREDIKVIALNLSGNFSANVLRHPWMEEVASKAKLMGSSAPGRLRKYDLTTPAGKTIQLERPQTDYYVLNFYRSSDPISQSHHRYIRDTPELDSIFQQVPLISINTEDGQAMWRLYLRDGAFGWPHFRSTSTKPNSLAKKLAHYDGGPYYVLINKQNRIEGLYDNLLQLAAAALMRQQKRNN